MLGRIRRSIKLMIMKKKWRSLNKHNYTTLGKGDTIDNISVGNKSYGEIILYQWGSPKEKLQIGNYVSIANDVRFVLGGNHRYDILSTYPFKFRYMEEITEAYSNGPIIVEDDVWIGMNCIILSGIRIGKGAVIAAGSVITRDVPPYSVVGGNPGKIIKYRFTNDIIEELKEFSIDDLSENYIKENISDLYSKVDKKLIEEIRVKNKKYIKQ